MDVNSQARSGDLMVLRFADGTGSLTLVFSSSRGRRRGSALEDPTGLASLQLVG